MAPHPFPRLDPEERFRLALALFDLANSHDPQFPKELLYAMRMSHRLDRLEPKASEALKLAARGQHICRWTKLRTDYPPGREGYRRWRSERMRFHAETASAILESLSYEPPLIARVAALVRKEGMKTDPEAQTLEDVACLVFLEHSLEDFMAKHDDAKLLQILRKTWKKMSPRGHEAARTLSFSARAEKLLAELRV